MNSLHRRDWLRLSGMAGMMTVVHGLASKTYAHSGDLVAEAMPARLSSNENPFGPSTAVREAIVNCFSDVCRYPFAKVQELSKVLADREGVTPAEIVVTGGSWEGLKAAGLTYGLYGGEVVSPHPTYLSLVEYAEQFGAHIHRVPLTDELDLDLEAMERRVTHQTRLVFVCNPNNPTGKVLPADRVRDFCQSLSKKTIVFSDEAYYDYVTVPNYPSMTHLIKEGANVIVSRTFSKIYGLAGLRLGYLVARADIAQRLRDNVMAGTNMVAMHAALAAVRDESFYRFSLQKNEEGRQYLYRIFEELSMPYLASHANFVFFKPGRPVQELGKLMAERSVMVGRPFAPLMDWCRISTGTMEDLEAFGRALKDIVS